ncbi:MAG: 5-methyltetrahydropteroyltriglutamate--homocysteine S-methyltransferase [Anaerolineales bacterium]
MGSYKTQTVGFPRIGAQREMKRALESYWKGKLEAPALIQTLHQVEQDAWSTQLEAGIDYIGVGDSTLYDHVLDWTIRLGLIPTRYQTLQGLDQYFAMARGAEGVPALELTKWFDTNYHYLVPEIEADLTPAPHFDEFLDTIQRAQKVLGERAVPIVLGPVTFLRLARLSQDFTAALKSLLPVYGQLLNQLKSLGVTEVQLHEPALVLGDGPKLAVHVDAACRELSEVGLPINLVTYFDDLGEAFEPALSFPVQTLTLNLTHGDNLERIRSFTWPQGKTLAAGIVDGRNIWRMQAKEALGTLEELSGAIDKVRVSASSSLQFVPVTVAAEPSLPSQLRDVLAFAHEKLEELALLGGGPSAEQLEALQARWAAFKAFAPDDAAVAQRLGDLSEAAFQRIEDYEARRPQQIQLPIFPTTTIGSFPQTTEIRRLRSQFKKGELTQEEYEDKVDAWIAYTIGIQEGLGLDVLVHGEFERSDMVEYFAQKLTGFAFTENGWVQSYGSRYVRPPIIYADVSRPEPMTVREFARAQTFTSKPVKGMLTGPVTILNWSFPRVDIPPSDVAYQLALALRDEIADLEAAGARVIQVDEPALREGLPFKPDRWHSYLDWAVDSFRLATGGAQSSTQIHTHMCYAEFGDILDAIDGLNADVISIENARSDDETLRELADFDYGREVGPGVYDVHSPVIADRQQVIDKLRMYLRHLPAERIWINPDCGLKTRGWKEVIPSLAHIVEAVETVRAEADETKLAAGINGR